jgi:DNA-binding transcriptional ArsR family regulator
MSARRADTLRHKDEAALFAALGDETRLTLLTRLGDGAAHSIVDLTDGLAVTRQAVTKHLRVLEGAGLVRGIRRGRESLFGLEPEPLAEARRALDRISEQWDQALQRLKTYVE